MYYWTITLPGACISPPSLHPLSSQPLTSALYLCILDCTGLLFDESHIVCIQSTQLLLIFDLMSAYSLCLVYIPLCIPPRAYSYFYAYTCMYSACIVCLSFSIQWHLSVIVMYRISPPAHSCTCVCT